MNAPPVVAVIDVEDLGCRLEIRSNRKLSEKQISVVYENWKSGRDKRRSLQGKTIDVTVGP